MKLFFGTHQNHQLLLSTEERHHIINVFRLKPGDEINVSDGNGKTYLCKINDQLIKNGLVDIIKPNESIINNPNQLILAVAPTKQMERMEWFLEKAVEIGLGAFFPILCNHSERKEIKTERLNKVVLSAAKQSLNPFLTKIHPIMPFKDFIENDFEGQKFICNSQAKISLKDDLKPNLPGIIIIGPEGDFHPNEIENATKKGYKNVNLGNSRLRTETAALFAAQAYKWVNM